MTRDKGWFSSLVPVVSRTYITFGDIGRGCVLSEGEIKVSDKVTFQVQSIPWAICQYPILCAHINRSGNQFILQITV
jgi:hypothetical protein